MLIKEVFIQAISALIGHRIRAAMTMTGIAWGIVAVVLLMAYGNGFHNAIMTGFRRAFSNGTVVVWNGQTSMQAGGERAGRRIRMKEGDVEAIRQLGLIKYASPEYVRYLPLANGAKQTTSAVRGVAPEYAEMRSEVAEFGRFINAEDTEKERRAIFLGSEVAKKLFGNAPAVGASVRVNGLTFEVIGVLTQKVSFSNYYSPDKYSVFIPHTTTKQLWNSEYLDNLVFQTLSVAQHNQAVKQVREVLASRHNFNPKDERAMSFNDSVENAKVIGGITGGLKIVLSIIGALTLMIGGIGVMNIMLVERHRADARDRRAKSFRRKTASHPDPIPARSSGDHVPRRLAWDSLLLPARDVRRPSPVFGRVAGRPDSPDRHPPDALGRRRVDRDQHPDGRRNLQRIVARAASVEDRPDRIVAL